VAIPAPDNKPGDFTKDGPVNVKRTITTSTGSVSVTNFPGTLRLWNWGKQTVKKNRHYLIDSILAWINPTIWWRKVVKYTYYPGTKMSVSVNQTTGVVTTTTYEGVAFNGPQNISHAMWAANLGILDTDAHRQVQIEALLKLNKGVMNFSQFVAESRESAGMLADTASTMVKLFRDVRHGRLHNLPKTFGHTVDLAGNIWLQWRYGWRPLASDIHGLYEFSKGTLRKPQIVSAKRTLKTPYGSSFSHNQHAVEFEGRHTDSCKLWAKVNDPSLVKAQNMGLVNPVSLAWELVPLSFVVDWFVPVGNYLECLTATSGLGFVSGYVGQERNATFKVEGDPGKLTIEGYKYERKVLTGFPSARIYANASPFNMSRITDMLALWNQFRKSKWK
jgi:hypothetical protein